MDSHSDRQNWHGLKDPVVKLERCDKIWKTLQLIRSMQDKHLEDIQDWIKREPMASEEILSRKPPMTFIPDKSLPLNLIGEPNLPKPYIKYQPIFNNGNESLPQFQLAEKSRVNLYHCEVCSQEYCDYKKFIDHQDEVHGISMPKRTVARREKLQNKKGDLKNRRNSADSNNVQFNKKLVSDENFDLQTIVKNSSAATDSIKCKLCRKWYKNIMKHMIEYHKIKCIEVLSKVTDQNSNFEKVQGESLNSNLLDGIEQLAEQTKLIASQDVQPIVQNSTNVLKRKLNRPGVGPCKKLRSVNIRDEESHAANQNAQLKCEICGKEYLTHKALCKHKSRHKSRKEDKQQSSETKRTANKSVDSVSSHKVHQEIFSKSVQDNDKDNINVVHKIPRTRSSFSKERSSFDTLEHGDVVASEITEKKNSEIKCLCGRSFRTAAILSNHKNGCKFLNNTDTSKSSNTRTGSDRDSGISITIKKKNNSYEIVSKEGSDEEPIRNGYDAEEVEISEETSDSSSDNSDSSEFDDQPESLVPEKSKYSANHRVMKLKLAEEDVDVEIEEDIGVKNCVAAEKYNDSNTLAKNKESVPLLRVLCKKYLIRLGIMPKEETSHKCQICKIFLGSKERLSKHVERHKKSMKKLCTCGIKFTCMKTFDEHVATAHPQSITCPYCKEKYKSIAGLGEHMCIIQHGAPYTETFNENHPCPNCNITFNNITWLDSHMRSKHFDPNLPFQCYQCLEKFPNEIARSLHSSKKHQRKSSCFVCNQEFQSFKTRQKHEAYHRGIGFPCHKCKKTYRSKSNQLNHVRTVHSDHSNDRLECFICQKSIKTKSFRKHVLRHNSNLQCEVCKKVVYDFRSLERHIMDCHRNEIYPRKKCNVCNVSFPTLEQLDAHIMIEKSVRNERYKNV